MNQKWIKLIFHMYLTINLKIEHWKGPFYLLHTIHYLIYLKKFKQKSYYITHFCPGLMVSFWSAKKVHSYFVRAKVYPLEIIAGSFKCNKNRSQVFLDVNETDTCGQGFLFGPANGEFRRTTIRSFWSFADPFNRFAG